MISRKSCRPRLDALETKTMMSTVSSGVGPVHLHSPQNDAIEAAQSPVQKIALSGQANGVYVSSEGVRGTETRFHLSVSGAIAPIGPAVVTGASSGTGQAMLTFNPAQGSSA